MAFLNSLKAKPPKATFQSYVDQNGEGVLDAIIKTPKASRFYDQGFDIGVEEPASMDVELLSGEIVITKAKARHFVPYSDEKNGHVGTLFVTNFKVSFVTLKFEELSDSMQSSLRRNKLIAADDVALANIEDIFYVSKGKRKRLVPGSVADNNVKQIEIHCKDFQMHTFSIDSDARLMVNAIVHHAFPSNYDLLFAFAYSGQPSLSVSGAESFRCSSENDWTQLLINLPDNSKLRVSRINSNHVVSVDLPEFFIVPQSLSDDEIKNAATSKKNSVTFPIWSFTCQNGASLFRMSNGLPETLEKKLLAKVRESHRLKHDPFVKDLCRQLPSLKDLQTSYTKLRELCISPSVKDVWGSDVSWFSALESCYWMSNVSCVLYCVHELVNVLHSGTSIVLKEDGNNNDYIPLVSSLVQIAMDPQCRSIEGFQSLIEREWVTFGHRFADRCGLTAARENEQGPVFLLFLDCTWQLLQQYHAQFEYSEIYLTSIWDSVTLGIFKNFVYSGVPRTRTVASSPRFGSGPLMSVWNWEHQFDSSETELFYNPVYVIRQYMNDVISTKKMSVDAAGDRLGALTLSDVSGRRFLRQSTDRGCRISLPAEAMMSPAGRPAPVLRVRHRIFCLQLWTHCYLRWMTPVQILNGGTPAEYVAQMHIVTEINDLRLQVSEMERALSVPASRVSCVPVAAGRSSRGIPSSAFAQSTATLSQRVSSSFPFYPCRPSNPAAFFGAQMMIPRVSYPEDAMSVDELSLNDAVEN